MHRTYKGRAVFVFVQICDAGHRIPGLEGAGDGKAPGLTNRRRNARLGMAFMNLSMPVAFDTTDGHTEHAYDAWPKRLVIVGVDGRIALDAGRGLPAQWDLAEVEGWLEGNTSADRRAVTDFDLPAPTDRRFLEPKGRDPAINRLQLLAKPREQSAEHPAAGRRAGS